MCMSRRVNLGTRRKLSSCFQRRQSSVFATPLEYNSALSLALDRPLYDPMSISEGLSGAHITGFALTCTLLLISSSYMTTQDAFDDFNDGIQTQGEIDHRSMKPIPLLKTLREFVIQFIQSTSNTVTSLYSKTRCIPLDQWSTCTLISKQHIANKYTRYSFGLPQPNQVAEKLVLMALDSQDRVCSLFTHASSARYGFDVVLENFESQGGEQDMSGLLQTLSPGSEVAVCGSRVSSLSKSKLVDAHGGLVVRGIKELYCLASGVGILPALNFLTQFLDSKRCSLDLANLVWVNKRKDEFMLDEAVEALWEKHSNTLDVSSVLDKFNSVSSFARNKPLMEVFPQQYSLGAMAVVSGPSNFVSSVSSLLADRGFPPAAISVIT